MANQHMSADKELFLDILTKEEREALLTKKMEEIRKKNEALRKRHEEIEADKRQAEKMVKPTSPKKEIKTVDFKPVKKEEFHRHSGSDFDYLKLRTDIEMTPTVDSLILPDLKFYSKILAELEVKRRPKPPIRGKGPSNRIKERPKSLDENGDLGIDSVYRSRRSMHAVGSTGGPHRLERMTTVPNNEMNEIHIQITDNVPEYRPNFANIRQTRDKHREREREKTTDFNGPPPDPAYNFLADRRREGPGYDRGDRDGGGGGGGGSSGSGGRGGGGECSIKDNRIKDIRRHPKNYGGIDFQNVKSKMKAARDRQGFNSTPPTKMEMSISMTGRERRQYMEWKAERDRVDKERIDRQKSASGEWRREWDAEKHQQECNVNQQFKLMQVSPIYEESSNSRRQESSRRPAGRIGSGRFDRGERDDRQRGEAPGTKEIAELKRPSRIGEKADKGKKLLGRGRGRGRGITAPPRSRIIPTNLASDSRKVECTRDLLVVKIDNSPGAQDDVEVEYSDSDSNAIQPVGSGGIASASIPISYDQTSHSVVSSPYSKSCPTPGCAPAEKMWDTIQENSWDQSQINLQNGDHLHCGNDEEDDDEDDDDDDDDEVGVLLEDEYIEDGELYSGIYEDAENDTNYGLVHGMAESEEWENRPDKDDYDSQLAYDKIQESLRLDCQLNPEAPAFVPTSPDFLNAPSENDKPVKQASVEHTKESLVQNKNKGVQLPNVSSSSAKEVSANTVDKDEVHENKVLIDSSSFSSSSSLNHSEPNQNLCKSEDSQKVVENTDKLIETDTDGLNCHDKCEVKPDGDDDNDAKFEDNQEAFAKSLSDSDNLDPDGDIETNKHNLVEETNLDLPATESNETIHSHNKQSANQVEDSDFKAKVTTETVRSETEDIVSEQIIKEIDVVDNLEDKDSKEVTVSKSEDNDSKEVTVSKSEDKDSKEVTVSKSEDKDSKEVTVSKSEDKDSKVVTVSKSEDNDSKEVTVSKSEDKDSKEVTVSKSEDKDSKEVTVSKSEDKDSKVVTVSKSENIDNKEVTVSKSEDEDSKVVTVSKSENIDNKEVTVSKSEDKDSKVVTVSKSENIDNKEVTVSKSEDEDNKEVTVSKSEDKDSKEVTVSKNENIDNKEVTVSKSENIDNKEVTVSKNEDKDNKEVTVSKSEDKDNKEVTVSKSEDKDNKEVTVSKSEDKDSKEVTVLKTEDKDSKEVTVSKSEHIDNKEVTVSKSENIDNKEVTVSKSENIDNKEVTVLKTENIDNKEVTVLKTENIDNKEVTVSKSENIDNKEVKVLKSENIDNKEVKMLKSENIDNKEVTVSKSENIDNKEVTVSKSEDKDSKEVTVSKNEDEDNKEVTVSKSEDEDNKEVTVSKSEDKDSKEVTVSKNEDIDNKEVTVSKSEDIDNKEVTVSKSENIDSKEVTVSKSENIDNKEVTVSKSENIDNKEVTVSKSENIDNKEVTVSKSENIDNKEVTVSKSENIDNKEVTVSKSENIDNKEVTVSKSENIDNKEVTVSKSENIDNKEVTVSKSENIDNKEVTVSKSENIDNKEVTVSKSENIDNKEVTVSKSENIDNKEVTVSKSENIDNKEVTVSKSENIDNKEVTVSKSENIDSEETLVPNTETETKTEMINEQTSLCNAESIVNEQEVDIRIEDNICKQAVDVAMDKCLEQNVSAESNELSERNVKTETSGETDNTEETAPLKKYQIKDVSVGDNPVKETENCLHGTSDAAQQRNDKTNRNTFYPTDQICAVTIKETLHTVKDAGAWKLSVKDDIETVSVYKSSNESNLSNSKIESVAAVSSCISESVSSSSSQSQLKETVSNNLQDSGESINIQSANNDLHKTSMDEKSKTESPDLLSDCSV